MQAGVGEPLLWEQGMAGVEDMQQEHRGQTADGAWPCCIESFRPLLLPAISHLQNHLD